MDSERDLRRVSAPTKASTDRVFCLAFETLHKRWDHTTDADQAERQQIIEELRQLTVNWRRMLEARELTRASLGLRSR